MKYPFKYTITMTQNSSPINWNISAMTQRLVNIQTMAYDTEAMLIEKEIDKRGFKDATAVLSSIMKKK